MTRVKPRPMPGVQVDGPCILWPGYINPDGYGIISYNYRSHPAHRFLYQLAYGPLPSGMQVDHLCRNRACINPNHLEPVTVKENVLRGMGFAAQNARKTHCKRGHPLSGENLIFSGGSRKCRICKLTRDNITRKARKERRKEQG